ncbi:DNA cytosine methyltransferase [Pseudomonas sp. MYb193]|uniref:DNA cytosine methyltransferase n=1 Tax=Pseudomonas sp. MYb193 TaxID=1827300 RepID=UPI000CF5DDB7|nr:DNA cytosine methyltransferase [Pseudomonas sp. MYb193]AVJ20964.1 DNA cytosine methyltransferase [Pseudomonas sp. MYb193]
MNELALFAGSGGGILGGHLLGWRTVCAVERDAYSAQVLAQRQNDGALATFPIWSDVCSFDGRPWRGLVDVVSGGFPCQDISAAGNGDGIDGARSGLWREMARVVGEVRPRFVYVENSPLLVGRGLALVLGDLAEMGYDAQWCIVSASDCGAPHQRDRIWIVANDSRGRCSEPAGRKVEQSGRAEVVSRGNALADADGARQPQPAGQQQECRLGPEQCSETMANANGNTGHEGRQGDAAQEPGRRNTDRSGIRPVLADAVREREREREREQRIVTGESDTQVRKEPRKRPDRPCSDGFRRWPAEPGMGRVADGVAHRVDRIKALGNGQVPRVAATAFPLLSIDND